MPCEKGSRNRVCPQLALALALFALRATKKEPCGSLEIPCGGKGMKNGAKETRTPDPLHGVQGFNSLGYVGMTGLVLLLSMVEGEKRGERPC